MSQCRKCCGNKCSNAISNCHRESLEKSKAEEAEETKEDAPDSLAHPEILSRRDSKDSAVSALTFQASSATSLLMNKSMLFVKPHANTNEVRDVIVGFLAERNYKIVDQGSVAGEELRECVDKQFADAGKKALVLSPHECSLSSISMMAFEQKFQISWSVAVRKQLVQNAHEACHILAVNAGELGSAWLESVRQNKVVKLGRDFFCGYIDMLPNKSPLFVINGHFLSMRDEYRAPTASVHYYCVEWDNAVTAWKDFRRKVIGRGDPTNAYPGSLREVLSARWQELGLSGPLDSVSPGVSASVSAFEAYVESALWPKDKKLCGLFGNELVKAGVLPDVLRDWASNVSVKGKPVFDHMEDRGSQDCVEMARHLLAPTAKRKKSAP